MNTTLSIRVECKACKGTGLYSGMAEQGRTAVVCRDCKGTGAYTYTGTEFTERKERDDIDKVFRTSGICVDEDSVGGVAYEEWLQAPESAERIGNELREYTCPYHTYQHCAYKYPIPLWKSCNKCLSPGMLIKDCQHYSTKDICWAIFDTQIKDEHGVDRLTY